MCLPDIDKYHCSLVKYVQFSFTYIYMSVICFGG